MKIQDFREITKNKCPVCHQDARKSHVDIINDIHYQIYYDKLYDDINDFYNSYHEIQTFKYRATCLYCNDFMIEFDDNSNILEIWINKIFLSVLPDNTFLCESRIFDVSQIMCRKKIQRLMQNAKSVK